MKKDSITARILEALSYTAQESAYLFAAIHEAGYGASQKGIEKKLEEIRSRQYSRNQPEHFKAERRNFYSMLSYLKREGLIEKKDKKWAITTTGKRKLEQAIDGLPTQKYKKEADNTLKIIIFDIPEKERGKRDWLRSRLTWLGFQLLQRSVWAGRKGIPQAFLEDIRSLGMLPYVEIFAVTKSGSLRTLKLE